jgi:hypothetical protein
VQLLKKSELNGTKYERKIKPTAQALKMYNNSAINPLGKCKVQLQNPASKKKYKVNFTIINDQDATSNLLGCSTVQSLGVIHTAAPDKPIRHVANISHVITDSIPNKKGMTLEDIKASYSDVFEGLGLLGPEWLGLLKPL